MKNTVKQKDTEINTLRTNKETENNNLLKSKDNQINELNNKVKSIIN
jgi:hypothetical protein